MAGYLEDLVQNIYTNCDMSGLDKLNQGLQDAIWYSGELEKNLKDAQNAQKQSFNLQAQAVNKQKEYYLSRKQEIALLRQETLARIDIMQKNDDYARRKKRLDEAEISRMQKRNALQRYFGRLLLTAFSINTLKNIIHTGSALQLTQKSIEGLTKSTQDWQFVEAIARKFGVSLNTVARGYKNFYAAASMAGFDKNNIQSMYADLLLSARAIGATEEQTGGALLALEQMISKGVVSMEELRRQLGNALPGAFEVGAKAMKMTTAEFNAFVKKGELASAEFVPKFIKAYKEAYSSGWKDIEQTFTVAQGRLGVAWERFTLQFMSGETGKGFAQLVESLIKMLESPIFAKFVLILGKVLSLVVKILSLALEQLPLILAYLGYTGLTKIIGLLIGRVIALQMAFFQATGSAITFGQAGAIAVTSISKAVMLLTAKLVALLGFLFIIQDIVYFLGERFWGWNTKSAIGAHIASRNSLKKMTEPGSLEDDARLFFKPGSKPFKQLDKAWKSGNPQDRLMFYRAGRGDMQALTSLLSPKSLPNIANGQEGILGFEKTENVTNDVKIDIKIDGGSQDPIMLGNAVYSKILYELKGQGIALNPQDTINNK